MDEIICTNCGSINDYKIVRQITFIKIYCNGCNKFIQNYSDHEPTLYFGKYFGTKIINFNTKDHKDYLIWCRRTPDIWGKFTPKLRDAINDKLIYYI